MNSQGQDRFNYPYQQPHPQIPQLNQYAKSDIPYSPNPDYYQSGHQGKSHGYMPSQYFNQPQPQAADEDFIKKEEQLLQISSPEVLLKKFMEFRNWGYKDYVNKIGDEYHANIEIEQEDCFRQISSNETKAKLKVILAVLYHYNSYLASLWCQKFQNQLAGACSKK
ncbi:unnamed protein product [Blepharisma stoltei]|uniref:Uncharacterized protein n=1 Tax=Blepharisma stoltei TaxID=1481888 RepID=A0AAU9JD20_9CILI|nr:unnamed protein product [Blepharisma stoltei]